MTSPFSFAAEAFDPTPNPHAEDPAGWMDVRLGESLWDKQDQAAHALTTTSKVAVPSCHDAGKSFLASRLACWWLDIHPPGEAFVVSTAPTFHQVRGILWREIGKAAAKAHARGNPLPGRVLETEWKIGTELVGWGRKPADHDEHGFQGIHARYVLVLIDEACGVPPQLWDAVESITTTSDARILAIGNPTDPTAEFARKCKPGPGWATVHIDGLTTPNMGLDTLETAARQIEPPLTEGQTQALLDEARAAGTPETAPGAPHGISDLLLQPSWVADKVRTWGIGSPMWQGKVRGLFPDSAEDALIPLAWIDAAQTRELEPRPDSLRTLAVDVARYGDDETVIGLREDERLRLIHFGQRQSTTETSGKASALHRERHTHEVRVDGVGVGGGVVDNLAESGVPVVDMQAGMAPEDQREFGNARAEWYWQLRRRFDPADDTFGSIDIDDELMAGQLQALKYRYDARGRIYIESKDDMKARGMPSPDRADVAMMAFADELVQPLPAHEVLSRAADDAGTPLVDEGDVEGVIQCQEAVFRAGQHGRELLREPVALQFGLLVVVDVLQGAPEPDGPTAPIDLRLPDAAHPHLSAVHGADLAFLVPGTALRPAGRDRSLHAVPATAEVQAADLGGAG